MGNVVPIRPAVVELDDVAKKTKIDRYGELKRRQALNQPDEDEAQILKEEIEGWHKDDSSEEGATENGLIYQVQLSPKTNKRTFIDKVKAFRFLRKSIGLEALIGAIEIPMGAIDKNIPKSAQHAFVSEERSGYRTFKVVPLHVATIPDLPQAA